MNVLSLFDGISTAHVALDKLHIPVDVYYASEIDKHAIAVTKHNYPDTICLGDVRKVSLSNIHHPIDLLCFGSPCQSFSFAGKRKGMSTKENMKVTDLETYLSLKEQGVEFEGQSYLFWEAVRLIKLLNPKYFFMENVVMQKEWEDVISTALGVKPVLVNSALTSPATRRRLYWTNIPFKGQPRDFGLTFGDVRERNVPKESGMYYTEQGMEWIRRHSERTGKVLHLFQDNEKMQMLEASMHKKYSSQRFFGIEDTYGIRYITPLECERCMGLPDGYTNCVSNTQRYRALGNGWEANTIAYLFSPLKKDFIKRKRKKKENNGIYEQIMLDFGMEE